MKNIFLNLSARVNTLCVFVGSKVVLSVSYSCCFYINNNLLLCLFPTGFSCHSFTPVVITLLIITLLIILFTKSLFTAYFAYIIFPFFSFCISFRAVHVCCVSMLKNYSEFLHYTPRKLFI